MSQRRVVITGAGGGIGRATALGLARAGARLALLDREEGTLAETARQAQEAGAEVHTATVDVTDAVAVDRVVRDAVQRLGGLDAAVGCAGVSGPVGTRVDEIDPTAWEQVFAVNASGSFHLLRAVVPALRAGDDASVVFVASDSALVAAAGMAAYCASKAAVVQLVKAASVDLADDGIRVNAVCPSVVDTPMSRGDLGLAEGFAAVDYPVQSAEEVARQILWLSSPDARPVNGHALVADFGFSARSMFPA